MSHITWNLAGLSLPLFAAAFVVPILIERLGHERFGLLALSWGLIGYAGSLDLGIGRAVTQLVSRYRGERKTSNIPDILATASKITLITGLIGCALIIIFAIVGGAQLIKTESTTDLEILYALLLLAIALPAQAMSATYRGINEAFMNFRGINIVRACLGVTNFIGPYIISHFSTELALLVSTLVISRLISLVAFKYLAKKCLQSQTEKRQYGIYSIQVARKLFYFGGWVTVSSVISPIMVHSDRFIIAAMISASAVSIYVVPYEVVIQSLVLAGAISSVMFPHLSRVAHEEPRLFGAYFKKWLKRVAVLMAFVSTMIALALPYVLPLWIGDNLENQSILIGQILCVGVFLNSIGSVYYSAIHAFGRSDLTAKVHIIELPIYLLMLVYGISLYGVKGAAMAWTARMALDALLLLRIGRYILRSVH